MTRWSNELNGEQQQLLDCLTAHCPRLSQLRTIVLDFRRALKSRDAKLLHKWIARAPESGFEPIARFATNLKKDIAEVTAAVETDWSNGQTEGQINRLKTVKRQMYGRAGFALLRARVLPYCLAYDAAGSIP